MREQVPGLGYPEGGVLGGLFNRERVGQGAGGRGGREPADGSGWRALRCKGSVAVGEIRTASASGERILSKKLWTSIGGTICKLNGNFRAKDTVPEVGIKEMCGSLLWN